LQDIVAVAVVAIGAMDIVSPLCGYRDTRVPWRHMFRAWEEPEMSHPEVINHPEPSFDSVLDSNNRESISVSQSEHETEKGFPDVEDNAPLPETLNHPTPETGADSEPSNAEDINLIPEPTLPRHVDVDDDEVEPPLLSTEPVEEAEQIDVNLDQPMQQASPSRATRPPAPVTEPDAVSEEAVAPPWWETSFPPTPPRATKPPAAKPKKAIEQPE